MAKQSSSELEEKLAARAVRELIDGMVEGESLVLLNYPQYDLDTVRELPVGDFEQLVKAAKRNQLDDYRMRLMVAGAATSAKSYKTMMSELNKAIKKLK